MHLERSRLCRNVCGIGRIDQPFQSTWRVRIVQNAEMLVVCRVPRQATLSTYINVFHLALQRAPTQAHDYHEKREDPQTRTNPQGHATSTSILDQVGDLRI